MENVRSLMRYGPSGRPELTAAVHFHPISDCNQQDAMRTSGGPSQTDSKALAERFERNIQDDVKLLGTKIPREDIRKARTWWVMDRDIAGGAYVAEAQSAPSTRLALDYLSPTLVQSYRPGTYAPTKSDILFMS